VSCTVLRISQCNYTVGIAGCLISDISMAGTVTPAIQ